MHYFMNSSSIAIYYEVLLHYYYYYYYVINYEELIGYLGTFLSHLPHLVLGEFVKISYLMGTNLFRFPVKPIRFLFKPIRLLVKRT